MGGFPAGAGMTAANTQPVQTEQVQGAAMLGRRKAPKKKSKDDEHGKSMRPSGAALLGMRRK